MRCGSHLDQRPHCRRSESDPPISIVLPTPRRRIALIVEPRCHPALEHVIRNASFFLGQGWQVQVFHSSRNAAFIRGLFSPSELRSVQLVCISDWREGLDDLPTAGAYSELLCSHWMWERVAAETVLIFQTDSLVIDSPTLPSANRSLR